MSNIKSNNSSKNQGSNLNYSWMFAMTGAAKAVNKIKSEILVSLNEQQLLDCISFDDSKCMSIKKRWKMLPYL